MTAADSQISRLASRVIVCGDNRLTYLLVQALLAQLANEVTVILPSVTDNRGPDIAQLPNVQVVEAPEPTEVALLAAGIENASAIALVAADDVGNLHAALRAHELNREARLVIRFFNMSLGHRIRTLFPGCAVLSDSATAAPSFVAAALGELAPNYVRLPGRTLYVARREEVAQHRLICGLADTSIPGRPLLLPPDETTADLVLALAEGTVADQTAGRHRDWQSMRMLWARVSAALRTKLAVASLVLIVLLLLGTVLFALVSGYSWPNAVYLTLLDAAGAAQPDTQLSTAAKVIQTMITITGIAIIPVVTAAAVDAVVSSRLANALGRPRAIAGHVVVAGLGNVGSRVVSQLHDLGIQVVCVENDEHARGIPLARRFGLPIVFGDVSREDTLRAAYVGTSRALVAVTSNDVINLEAALHGRAIKDDLRVVLRLFDDDLAQRVQNNFGITISRSVSFLAAPAFAAAMVQRQVLGTIPVGRTVLLIAEVPVRAGSPLEGLTAHDVRSPGEARVIAIQRRATELIDMSVPPDCVLNSGDRLIVLATRSGLGRVLARSMAAVPAEG